MLDIDRDIRRLEIISEDLGLENYSTQTRLHDLLSYFVSRFLKNFQNVFKEFSHSELEDFLLRHPNKTDILLKDPLLNLTTTIFPIPKGMLKSYKETMFVLDTVVKNTHSDAIASDIQNILDMLTRHNSRSNMVNSYTRKLFDEDRNAIGNIFSAAGLTHTTGNKAFLSVADITVVKDNLLAFTKQHYPQVFMIHEKVKQLEAIHSEDKISNDMLNKLRENILSLGYRISIFSKAISHVHELEHAFVKGLTFLMKNKR